MEFLAQYKNSLFLIVVLLAQAIGLAVQVRSPLNAAQPDGPSVRLIRMWAMAAVTPLERATHAIGSGVRNGWSGYIDLRHVHRQNRQLEQQIAQMRIAEDAISEDALEGQRLQALLGFRESYVGSTVVAQVIGGSGSDQSRVLTIDKGSRDGLKPDMAVITANGIVGKLQDVFPGTSQVLEIDDQNSGAGVLLAGSRIRAILHGTLSGELMIGNLTADSRIKPGDRVLTSGGDQVFPRGLPVGTIESIRPDPDNPPYTAIRVKPAVDLDRVEEVLVITATQPDLTPEAQLDLATAAEQHAAGQEANQLPGKQLSPAADGSGNGTTAPGAAAAPVAIPVPRPLPAIHPDQFSSGSTPPASQMTPGAADSAPVTQSNQAEGQGGQAEGQRAQPPRPSPTSP